MHFHKTPINGAFVIDPERRSDERGFFARIFCTREFARHGIKGDIAQSNICYNRFKGTIRGMHYQAPPALEPKLIRCIRGAIHDAIIDMRPDSPTRGKSFAVELTAENRRSLFVPEVCAHGYQVLEDGSEVLYQAGGFYAPECERGVRYDDPALRLDWPLEVTSVSDKDANWPLLESDLFQETRAHCWQEAIHPR